MGRERSVEEMKVLNKKEKKAVQLNLRVVPEVPVMIDDLIEDFRQRSGGQLKVSRNQLLTILIGSAHKKMKANRTWWSGVL